MRISINLKKGNLYCDGESVIINRKLRDNVTIEDHRISSVEDIECLYNIYKHSVPHDNTKKQNYFRALDLNDLSEDDIIRNDDRTTAAYNLEVALLVAISSGRLKWSDLTQDDNHWFWQSSNDPDLVILKEWFN